MEPKIKVLIAEDQELTSMGLKSLLSKQPDIEVIGIASDGEKAVTMTLDAKPDVVIMDIGLPVLNGIDATAKIREKAPQTKFLILTSHREANQVFAAMSAGAQGYCLKEVSIKRLEIALRAVSNGDCWLDPDIAKTVFTNLNANQGAQLEENEPVTTLAQAKAPGNRTRTTSAHDLSEREMEVLKLLVAGQKNTEIAETLCISLDTVKSHMSKIMDKLAVADRTQAALKALREGLVSL